MPNTSKLLNEKLADLGGVQNLREASNQEVFFQASGTVFVKRLSMLVHQGAADLDIDDFGGLGALPNGIQIVKKTPDGEESLIGPPIRVLRDAHDAGFLFGGGVGDTDWALMDKTFDEVNGAVVRLRTGERIVARTTDTISSVSWISFAVNGYVA